MKITWFGTASVAIETEKQKLLFDPYLTMPGSENRTTLKMFAGYDKILITHGHFDHLASVPEILDAYPEAIVYATDTPVTTLYNLGVAPERMRLFEQGDEVDFGDISVKILKGRHIHFDKELIKKTAMSPRMLRYAANIPKLYALNRDFPENEETIAYEIHAEGKTILLLGSLGLDTWTDYPRGILLDLLILPYQGCSNPVVPAATFIERLKPKMVMLDHFDDAFPPASTTVDTRPLKRELDRRMPGLKVVKPKAGKTLIF